MVTGSCFYDAPVDRSEARPTHRYVVLGFWPGEDCGEKFDDFPTISQAEAFIRAYKSGWPGITFSIYRQENNLA